MTIDNIEMTKTDGHLILNTLADCKYALGMLQVNIDGLMRFVATEFDIQDNPNAPKEE